MTSRHRVFSRGFNLATLCALVLASLVVVSVASPDWNARAIQLFRSTRDPAPPLNLHAATAGDYFRISWNPDAVASRIDKAVLFIGDGGLSRNLNLSPADLRIGRLIYASTSTDVRFRLEIWSDRGGKVMESVIALGEGSRNGKPNGEHNGGSRQDASLAEASADRAVNSPSERKSKPGLRPPAVPAHDIVTVESNSATRTATLPPVTFPPPPDINPAGTAYAGVDLGVLRDQPRAVQYDEPSLPSKAPVVSKPAILPPQAVKQVQPKVSKEIRTLMTNEQRVDVRVTIDPTGQVTGAAVISQSGPLSGLLTRASLDAARRWVFRPAQLGGTDIPSEHIISFVFASSR